MSSTDHTVRLASEELHQFQPDCTDGSEFDVASEVHQQLFETRRFKRVDTGRLGNNINTHVV